MLRFLLECVSPVSVYVAGALTSLAVTELSVTYALYAIAMLSLSIIATIADLTLDN